MNSTAIIIILKSFLVHNYIKAVVAYWMSAILCMVVKMMVQLYLFVEPIMSTMYMICVCMYVYVCVAGSHKHWHYDVWSHCIIGLYQKSTIRDTVPHLFAGQ